VFQIGNEPYEIGQISAQPVQSPNDQRVAFTQALETAFKMRPAGVFSDRLLFIYFSAFSPLEGIFLQAEILVVGRYASVANPHVPNLIKA
jgi:hypothetical protein